MRRLLHPLAALLLLALMGDRAWALGFEHVGPRELSAPSYDNWPGLFAVLDTKGLVYDRWINGNEALYYAGNTRALNAALKAFADVKIERRQVTLYRGPGEARTFQGKSMPCHWSVHCFGGLALPREGDAEGVKPLPMMIVWVGGDIDLGDLEVPAGITLMTESDHAARSATPAAESAPPDETTDAASRPARLEAERRRRAAQAEIERFVEAHRRKAE